MPARSKPPTPLVLVLATLLIAACGQKGPLYLPGEAPRPVLPGATPAQDGAADSAPQQGAEDGEDKEEDGDRGP